MKVIERFKNGTVSRRRFIRNAAGMLVPAMAPLAAYAGLITQSGPRLFGTEGGGGAGFTFDSGWSGTGVFADNELVTVEKAAGGLSIPTDPRPLLWIPLQTDFLRDATYSRTSVTMTARNGCTISTSMPPTNHSGFARQTWPITPNADDHCFFSNDPVWSFSTTRVYVSCKRRYNWNPLFTNNDKSIRFWPSPGASAGTPDYYVLLAQNDSGNSSCQAEGYADYHDTTTAPTTYFACNWPSADTWVQDEYEYADSSVDAYDGIHRFYRNGGVSHALSTRYKTRGSPEPGTAAKAAGYLDQFANPNDGADPMTSGTKHLDLCDLYITDTLFRIVVSAESSWTTTVMNNANDPGIAREVQLPTSGSGSDTGCGLLLRRGAHASLSGKYLWFCPTDFSSPQRIGQFT